MQNVIIERPYRFIPPVYSDWWPTVIRLYLHRYLRKSWGIHSVECREVDRFRDSLAAGHSIILTPNHSRLSDPLVLGVLAEQAGCYLFAMASWHLFNEDWFTTFMIRRMGAFSVYREGNDRAALNEAIEILAQKRRPLVVFPEGALSRHNDLLMDLMDGPAFIARQAAKRRAKASPPGKVVVHPVAIRYSFDGDLHAALEPILDRFEARFTWPQQAHLPLMERIRKIGEALLSLKEVEYLGRAQPGDPYDRAESLIDTVLSRLEKEWNVKDSGGSVVSRVKTLRSVILPDMIDKKVPPAERERRWRDLSACYYVQQISHYPRGYINRELNLPERILETVERYEEDFTDQSHRHEPMGCTIKVGTAIPVAPERDRTSKEEPITKEIRSQLQTMLAELAAERTPVDIG
jgi:1-acyl-sn-glycerol-3-phosphate acyltransferase